MSRTASNIPTERRKSAVVISADAWPNGSIFNPRYPRSTTLLAYSAMIFGSRSPWYHPLA
ncbi:unannotated protein [freshwater metagenome]|uniref:Unannotated protein n=1 Tax=freshwater metagenome TaxID=449393 RepID=A0A6J7LPP7_9ZZZZ